MRPWTIAVLASLLLGCGSAIIEPGHLGVLFDPAHGGLQREVLRPGSYPLHCGVFTTACPRIDDFDATYQTRHEDIAATSSEGLSMQMRVAVTFRPIFSELYNLESEIGRNYYEAVIGPEFRSATRTTLAMHSYVELQKRNERMEDDIESALRRRCAGKHVEIASILIERTSVAPEIEAAARARFVAEQAALRATATLKAEAQRRSAEIPSSFGPLIVSLLAVGESSPLPAGLATQRSPSRDLLRATGAEIVYADVEAALARDIAAATAPWIDGHRMREWQLGIELTRADVVAQVAGPVSVTLGARLRLRAGGDSFERGSTEGQCTREGTLGLDRGKSVIRECMKELARDVERWLRSIAL